MVAAAKSAPLTPEERFYLASQWQLMWVTFRRHNLAMLGGTVLLALYLTALFADFLPPYTTERRFSASEFHAPTAIHIIDTEGGWHWPFIYDTKPSRDPETLARIHTEDTSQRYPIQLFFRDEPHKVLGVFET